MAVRTINGAIKAIIDGIESGVIVGMRDYTESYEVPTFQDAPFKHSVQGATNISVEVMTETGTKIEINNPQYYEWNTDNTILSLWGVFKRNNPHAWQISFIKNMPGYKENKEYKYNHDNPLFYTPETIAYKKLFEHMTELVARKQEKIYELERQKENDSYREGIYGYSGSDEDEDNE